MRAIAEGAHRISVKSLSDCCRAKDESIFPQVQVCEISLKLFSSFSFLCKAAALSVLISCALRERRHLGYLFKAREVTADAAQY
jgi:hypothetical protein